MAITAYKEEPGRNGVIGSESVRTFIFWSNNSNDTEHDIYRHFACPRIGSRHPNPRFIDYFLKPGDLSISQGSGKEWAKWTVEATYKRLKRGEEEPKEQPDPADSDVNIPDFNPRISIDFEDYSAPIDLGINVGNQDGYDTAGNTAAGVGAYPVVNSAIEPYETPPEMFKQNAIIRVARNVKLNDRRLKDAQRLRNTINTDEFEARLGQFRQEVKPYQGRLKIRLGERQTYQDEDGDEEQYLELECQWVTKQEGWKIFLLDTGSYYLDPSGKSFSTRVADNDWSIASGTDKVPFKDKEQNRSLGLLNGSGAQISSGDPATFNEIPSYFEKQHAAFFKRMTRRKT